MMSIAPTPALKTSRPLTMTAMSTTRRAIAQIQVATTATRTDTGMPPRNADDRESCSLDGIIVLLLHGWTDDVS